MKFKNIQKTKIIEQAKKNIRKYQEKYAVSTFKEETYLPGDLVWYYKSDHHRDKLAPTWDYHGKVIESGFKRCKILLEIKK